jgi:hypothetical protein
MYRATMQALGLPNMCPEEVVLKGQVLIPGGHFGDIDQREASLVVLKHCGSNQGGGGTLQFHLGSDLLEKGAHGEDFSHGHAEGHTLCCCGAQGLVSLQLAGPQNGASKQGEGEPGPGANTHWILIIFMSP